MPKKVSKNGDSRRSYIFRRGVLENRPISINELINRYGKTKRLTEMIERDIKSFAEIGCIFEKEAGDEANPLGFLRFRDGLHTDDDAPRIGHRKAEKELAAGLAAGLICGFSDNYFMRDGGGCALEGVAPSSKVVAALEGEASQAHNPKAALAAKAVLDSLRGHPNPNIKEVTQRALFNRSEIVGQLTSAFGPLERNCRQLLIKLTKFWNEATRLIYLDAGTTNLYLALKLATLSLPAPREKLASLTVATNSRRIWTELGPAVVPIKTVIIGGMQKFRSAAVCGSLAENFLRSSNLLAGVAMVGTTRLDLENGCALSDSLEEANIKCLMFDHSAVKLLLTTSDKFQVGPGREGYPIVPLDPASVDAVITNAPFKSDPDPDAASNFARSVEMLRRRELPVLVATHPDLTIAWPS